MIAFRVKHIETDKVVFASFNGKNYADNPKAISVILHEMDPDLKIVWAYRNSKNQNIPQYVRQVKFDSVQYYMELATAKVWVNNGNLLEGTMKRKGQFYIQTWHGDRVPKKVLYDAIELESYKSRHSHLVVPEEKLCDLCIAGSDLGESVYRSAFRYKGKILKTGTPRSDALVNFDSHYADEIRHKLKIKDNYHCLLYAPTFRDGTKVNQDVAVDLSRVLDLLEKRNEKWICLLRAHVASAGLKYDKNDQRLIDVTSYDDIADLMLISDILLTDYSSCCGDFILLNRPVILCHYDFEKYKNECRGFNIDFDQAGFMIAHNQIELEDIICKLPGVDISENCNKILRYFGTIESGHASKDVCQIILEYMRQC